jgi:hypothetical protein
MLISGSTRQSVQVSIEDGEDGIKSQSNRRNQFLEYLLSSSMTGLAMPDSPQFKLRQRLYIYLSILQASVIRTVIAFPSALTPQWLKKT